MCQPHCIRTFGEGSYFPVSGIPYSEGHTSCFQLLLLTNACLLFGHPKLVSEPKAWHISGPIHETCQNFEVKPCHCHPLQLVELRPLFVEGNPRFFRPTNDRQNAGLRHNHDVGYALPWKKMGSLRRFGLSWWIRSIGRFGMIWDDFGWFWMIHMVVKLSHAYCLVVGEEPTPSWKIMDFVN